MRYRTERVPVVEPDLIDAQSHERGRHDAVPAYVISNYRSAEERRMTQGAALLGVLVMIAFGITSAVSCAEERMRRVAPEPQPNQHPTWRSP